MSFAYRILYERCISVRILKDNVCSLGKARGAERRMAAVVTVKKIVSKRSSVGKDSRYDKMIRIYYIVVL